MVVMALVFTPIYSSYFSDQLQPVALCLQPTIVRCKVSNNIVTACQAVHLAVPDPAVVDKVTIPGFRSTNITLRSSQDKN